MFGGGELVELDRVSFRYTEMEKEALQDISLKVDRGKCLVLSGSSGCGDNAIMMIVQ